MTDAARVAGSGLTCRRLVAAYDVRHLESGGSAGADEADSDVGSRQTGQSGLNGIRGGATYDALVAATLGPAARAGPGGAETPVPQLGVAAAGT